MNSFYCPDFRDMSHVWYLRSSLTPLLTLLIPTQFPLIPSHDLKTSSNHPYMLNFTPLISKRYHMSIQITNIDIKLKNYKIIFFLEKAYIF